MTNGYIVVLGFQKHAAKRPDGTFKWSTKIADRHVFATLEEAQKVANEFNIRLPHGIVSWEVNKFRG